MPALFCGCALGNMSGRKKKKEALFVFLIARHIYQSQLTMVCLILSQIPAELVGHV